MMTYRTKNNEVLDYICWKYYFLSKIDTTILQTDTYDYDGVKSIENLLLEQSFVSDPDENRKMDEIISIVLDANPHLLQHTSMQSSSVLGVEPKDFETLNIDLKNFPTISIRSILPSGTSIFLPDIDFEEEVKVVSIWD